MYSHWKVLHYETLGIASGKLFQRQKQVESTDVDKIQLDEDEYDVINCMKNTTLYMTFKRKLKI